MLLFLCILFSYICGSIPSGLWLGRYFYHTDIRQHGSGNIGSTNTFRILGKKAGSIVLAMDILKGAIPVFVAQILCPNVHPLLIGVFAIIGHTYPVFAQFKGGKAVATSAGAVLACYPIFLLAGLVIFLISLYFSRMVSFSSMLSAICLSVIALFMQDMILLIITISLTGFIIYRHRDNIQRIKDGNENKVPFGYQANTKRGKS